MTDINDAPPHLDTEEQLLWKNADGFARSLLRRISISRAETKQARDWAEKTVQEIAAARVLTCVYCGHQYPDGTPAAKHAALTEHIQKCPKHPMTELRQKVTSFCDTMTEALGAEPLAEEEHDLDVLAETIMTRLEAQNREDGKLIAAEKELHDVMNAILAPFGKKYRTVAIEDLGTKEKVQGEGIVGSHMPGSDTVLVRSVMDQHVAAYTNLRDAAASLLAALVVHATPAAGSPVDSAAKNLNDLVKEK